MVRCWRWGECGRGRWRRCGGQCRCWARGPGLRGGCARVRSLGAARRCGAGLHLGNLLRRLTLLAHAQPECTRHQHQNPEYARQGQGPQPFPVPARRCGGGVWRRRRRGRSCGRCHGRRGRGLRLRGRGYRGRSGLGQDLLAHRILPRSPQRGHIGPAGLALLGQRPEDDRIHLRGQVWVELAGLGRVQAQVGLPQAGEGAGAGEPGLLSGEGPPAGDHLEEHHAQAVDVGAGVQLAAQDLFGAHVGGGAHGHGGDGGALQGFGDAEVGEEGAAMAVDHDVAGLEVAVDEAFVVGVVEGGGQLPEDVGGLGQGQGAFPLHQEAAEGDAVDVFEDDEGDGSLAFEGEEADDVGVVELGQGLGLAGEAADEVGVFGQVFAEDFDGDPGHASAVEGEEDVGHAAAADGFEDFVAIAENLSWFNHDDTW